MYLCVITRLSGTCFLSVGRLIWEHIWGDGNIYFRIVDKCKVSEMNTIYTKSITKLLKYEYTDALQINTQYYITTRSWYRQMSTFNAITPPPPGFKSYHCMGMHFKHAFDESWHLVCCTQIRTVSSSHVAHWQLAWTHSVNILGEFEFVHW